MSQEKKDWIIAIGYVALIYATIGVVRIPLGYLRSHGWLKLSLAVLYVSACLGLLAMLARRSRGEIWRYVVLVSIWGTYYAVARSVQTPEEQIHFFEYGLVGVLFVRALRWKGRPEWRIFLEALLLATLCGYIDEVLQGLNPNRHYDMRDVVLNFTSAFLGLWLYRILPSRQANS